ncbi:MAG: Maf family protein [Microthrixaceae bacterium]
MTATDDLGNGRPVLASASPRRRELLARLGVEVEVDPADLDERPRPGERATDLALRLAAAKAATVAARHRGRVVLAADTVVEAPDGAVLGQPVDDGDAVRMLTSLAGAEHHVVTAVAVVGADGVEATAVERAAVRFAALDREEIDEYVATGEPTGKAGAYAVQGIGAVLVERVNGDPTTVIGLPLRVAARLLAGAGITVRPGPRVDPGRRKRPARVTRPGHEDQ